ncbi:MAG: SH3 domain-containing protein [Caldilineaceae bacterium]
MTKTAVTLPIYIVACFLFAALLLAPERVHAQSAPVEPAGKPAQLGTVNRSANLRAGPGTKYAVVGSAPAGTTVHIAGTNKAGDWYHLSNGRWIAAFLVDRDGASALASAAPATSANTAAPAATATATPVPAPSDPPTTTSGNQFVVIERRLWDVYENGGTLDGPSVHCGEGRELHVNVLDANGSRLNGVAVQVQYGARETIVTGSQGKGDGVSEFVLGGGQDVKVVRDTDGSPVTSDVATGLSTNPNGIDQADLIAAGYCQDADSCHHFAINNGCLGHFSWNVTFQRR